MLRGPDLQRESSVSLMMISQGRLTLGNSFYQFVCLLSLSICISSLILLVGNYCTLGKLSLILFAFDIYDQDKSGFIDIKEAQSLVKDVYGSKYELNVHAKRYTVSFVPLSHALVESQQN